MLLKFHGQEYVCESVKRINGRIEIHTGRNQDGQEIVHYIYGDIDTADVKLEGGTWDEAEDSSTLENRVETLEESNAELTDAVDMILSGVTE